MPSFAGLLTGYTGVMSQLAEVGITQAKIDAAIGSSPTIRAAVIQMTEKVRDTWQEIWDEGDDQHKYPGHPYETPIYRNSLTTELEEKPSGYINGVVRTMDRKAFWLEYGTVRMAEFAPAAKTIARLGGRRGDGRNWAGDVSS